MMTVPVSRTLSLDEALQEAVAHHRVGQLKEAEELYRAILAAQPMHADANHNLGVVAMQQGRPATALPCIRLALDANPGNGQYWLSYIEALIQTGQDDTARQVLEDARQRGLQGAETDALAVRLTVGKPSIQETNTLLDMFNQGRYAEAVAFAQKMTVNFPRHGFAWKVLGASLQPLGRNEEAWAAMQKSAALSPEDALAHYNLGVLLIAMGRLAEAEASFRQTIRIQPDHAQAHYNLGIVLQDSSRLEDAEISFRQAIRIKPEYAEACNNLGILCKALSRLDEAETRFRQAIGIRPDYAEAHGNLASILFESGRQEEAEASCRRALQIAPDSAQALRLLKDIGREQGVLPDYLAAEVFDHANGRLLRRYFPYESSAFIYHIDVSGTCNLRCPSCPVGNFPDARRSKGFMELDLFRGIVEKIKQDRVGGKPVVWLFNWGEPLLHPQLPEMIALLKQNDIHVMISTNLNIKKNLEEVIRSGPDEMKISLSGFSQAFYAKTHVKGKIALVKENMRLVRHWMDKYSVPINVWVGHHLYRHNSHEADEIKEACHQLNFGYRPIPAYYQPLEKMVDLIEGRVSTSDADLLNNLPVPPLEALAARRKATHPDFDCEMRFGMTVINHDGSVALCPGTYDAQNMLGVNFVDTPHDDIQALKYRHPFCRKCYAYGLQYSYRPVVGV